jgi:hypothetical protein
VAKHVLRDAMVSVNSVDLSDHVSAVSIETSRPEVDVTSMGADYMEIIPGIPDATVTVSFFNDYAAGEVYATLQPLSTTDTPFPIAIRPTTGAISATNPEMQMSVLMYSFSPISGDVGSANTMEATFRNASQTGITYDTTP